MSLSRATLASVRGARRALSSAAERKAGTLYICGTGESHKLGLGDKNDRETPTLLKGLEDVPVVHAACGKYHSAALSESGDVYMWGLESSGQLGLGSYKTKAPTPQKVESLSGIGVKSLSCGMYHTLALTEEGEVYSCGYGGSLFSGAGGLGLGTRKQQDSPQKVAAFGRESGVLAASIGAGGYHSVVYDDQGGVWTWGRGEWGRLGHSDASDQLSPLQVDECSYLSPASAYAAESHTGCLGTDGAVYTWGRNEHWQLGYEVVGLLNSGQSFDAQQEPAKVEALGEAKAAMMAVGEQATAVVLDDGTVWFWGMARHFVPTQVPGTGGIDGAIVQLHCGSSHLALLAESGKVYTYGKGTALGMPKVARKSWELNEVTAESLTDHTVVGIACGDHTTALIVQ